MTTTVRAVFDGHVFRPDEPVPLEPNARYVLTVERRVILPGPTGVKDRGYTRSAPSAPSPPTWESRTWRRATTGTPAAGRPTRTGRTRTAVRRAMRRSGSPVFLDTAYVYALLNARDSWHAAAVAWERRLAARRRRLVTLRSPRGTVLQGGQEQRHDLR
jgi:hypothetical protein